MQQEHTEQKAETQTNVITITNTIEGYAGLVTN